MTQGGSRRTVRAAALVAAAVCVAALPASGPPVADRVCRLLQAERAKAGAGPLERRAELDRAAGLRAREVADRPASRRLQETRPVEDVLREVGFRRFLRAREYVDVQSGYPDPAAALLQRWRHYPQAWGIALDPAIRLAGVGQARAAEGALVVVVVLVEPGRVWSARDPETELRRLEGEIFRAVNRIRRKRGLPKLRLAEDVAEVARAHSRDMAGRGYLAHRSLDGDGPSERLRKAGVRFQEMAENIGRNRGNRDPARAAVEGWMRSLPHRRNLLDRSYTETGVGVAADADGTLYFTQLFVHRPTSSGRNDSFKENTRDQLGENVPGMSGR